MYRPGSIFLWNERPYLEADGKLAKESDEGTVSFIVPCKYCGTRNKIWVTKLRKTEEITRIIGEISERLRTWETKQTPSASL